VDKEQAIRIKESMDWELICLEIDKDIEMCKLRLETANPEMVKQIQMQIREKRNLKRLPQDIIDKEGGI